jgi:hypothetical protein
MNYDGSIAATEREEHAWWALITASVIEDLVGSSLWKTGGCRDRGSSPNFMGEAQEIGSHSCFFHIGSFTIRFTICGQGWVCFLSRIYETPALDNCVFCS